MSASNLYNYKFLKNSYVKKFDLYILDLSQESD